MKKNLKETMRDNNGFSLVELIIVIAIMAVLVGILSPQYLKYVQKSRVSTDITNAEEVATAFNVAIADEKLTPTAETTAKDTTGVENLKAFPASKAAASLEWIVTYSSSGVSQITLGGIEIYPDSSNYESKYVK
jgi:type IV pilus assembly protein PilA